MATGSKAASKVAGKAKGATKALAGYPGIFHHLAEEHGEVSALMARVVSSADDSEVREELFPRIRKSLLAHARAEEQEFYPVLQEFPELGELVTECIDEHHKVERYLEQLASGNKETKTWREVFETLQNAVTTHVEREEEELFPKARDCLSAEQATEMQERYERAEEREKESL